MWRVRDARAYVARARAIGQALAPLSLVGVSSILLDHARDVHMTCEIGARMLCQASALSLVGASSILLGHAIRKRRNRRRAHAAAARLSTRRSAAGAAAGCDRPSLKVRPIIASCCAVG